MLLKFFNETRISSIDSVMPGDVISLFALSAVLIMLSIALFALLSVWLDLVIISPTLLNVFDALAIKLVSFTFCVMFLKFFNAMRMSSIASGIPGAEMRVLALLMALSALFMVLSTLLNVFVALAIKLESSTFCVMFLKFFNVIRMFSIASGMPGVPISVFALSMALSALCIVLLAV